MQILAVQFLIFFCTYESVGKIVMSLLKTWMVVQNKPIFSFEQVTSSISQNPFGCIILSASYKTGGNHNLLVSLKSVFAKSLLVFTLTFMICQAWVANMKDKPSLKHFLKSGRRNFQC